MAVQSIQLDPVGARLFSANQAEYVLANGTNFPQSGYAFDATTSEQILLVFKAVGYLSGNLTLTLKWYAAATTNNCVWGAQIACSSDGDAQSVLTKAFASVQTTTTAPNGTTNGPRDTVITISNLDSIAADDWVCVRVYRDAAAGGDTMTGDAILFDVEIEYAATGGVGSGNVNNAGSSTDNAVARFDGTTGQVIQNSAVTVDDSGNIAGVGTYNGVTVDKHEPIDELSGSVALTTGTTLQNVTGLSISLPRAGTYWIEGMLDCTATATLTSAYGLNVSANFTRMAVCWTNFLTASTFACEQQQSSLASGGTGVASGSRSVTSARGVMFSGSITVSGAATVQVLASRSTSTLTFNAGSSIMAREQ